MEVDVSVVVVSVWSKGEAKGKQSKAKRQTHEQLERFTAWAENSQV